jgi:hypothetical protein
MIVGAWLTSFLACPLLNKSLDPILLSRLVVLSLLDIVLGIFGELREFLVPLPDHRSKG